MEQPIATPGVPVTIEEEIERTKADLVKLGVREPNIVQAFGSSYYNWDPPLSEEECKKVRWYQDRRRQEQRSPNRSKPPELVTFDGKHDSMKVPPPRVGDHVRVRQSHRLRGIVTAEDGICASVVHRDYKGRPVPYLTDELEPAKAPCQFTGGPYGCCLWCAPDLVSAEDLGLHDSRKGLVRKRG